MRRTTLILASTITALALPSLPGCQTPHHRVLPSFQLGTEAATLIVKLGRGGYQTLYLRETEWDLVEGTLTGTGDAPQVLTVSAEAVLDTATHRRSAALRFDGVRPGDTYSLGVKFKKRAANGEGRVVGTLAKEVITVDAGTNTVELDGTVQGGTQPILTAPRALGGYVTSFPAQGTPGRLQRPADLVVGHKGIVYVADNHYLRRIAPDAQGRPTLTTIAGQAGKGAIDGPGEVARFGLLTALAIDADGVIYAVDAGNRNIRRIVVDEHGKVMVATIAGSGVHGSQDGPGATAQFKRPVGLTVDRNGNLYLADADDFRIRKLTRDEAGTYTVSTLAGNGQFGTADGNGQTAQLGVLSSLVVDEAGTIYFIDTQRIRKVVQEPDGSVTVSFVAGGTFASFANGPGDSAKFAQPAGLLLDGQGGLLVADAGNYRVRKVMFDAQGNATVTTHSGSGTPGGQDGAANTARYTQPIRLAAGAGGRIYVLETVSWCIREVSPDTTGALQVSTVIGDGTSNGYADGPYEAERFFQVICVTFGRDGYAYLTDKHRVWRANFATGEKKVVAGSLSLGFADGPGSTARFHNPHGLAMNGDGELFVADTDNRRLRKLVFDENGNATVSTVAGTGVGGFTDGPGHSATFMEPLELRMDSAGNLISVDEDGNRIRKVTFDATGNATVSTVAGGAGGQSAQGYVDGPVQYARFDHPVHLEFGPLGEMYVSDRDNAMIRKISTNASGETWVSTIAGTGVKGFSDGPGFRASFNQPQGLAYSPDGKLYLLDGENHSLRVLEFDSAGNVNVSTLAGGMPGFVDGPLAQARFTRPSFAEWGPDGALYVTEFRADVIRRVVF